MSEHTPRKIDHYDNCDPIEEGCGRQIPIYTKRFGGPWKNMHPRHLKLCHECAGLYLNASRMAKRKETGNAYH